MACELAACPCHDGGSIKVPLTSSHPLHFPKVQLLRHLREFAHCTRTSRLVVAQTPEAHDKQCTSASPSYWPIDYV